MRLPVRARSYAVLIGTAHHDAAELVDLPAVRTNLVDLQAALTDPALGWLDPDRCAVVEDAADGRAVYQVLRPYAAAAEDTLLVYFAGHGRIGQRNELFLSLTGTDPDALPVSALAYDTIRDLIAESPATNRIVVLDCCFSGRAVADMAGDLMGQLGISGTYVLTATPPNAVALAPLGARHTAFTGLLLALLRKGVPDGPALLSLAVIHRELLRTATERGLPRPQQRGTGTSQHLALVRNAAKAPRPPAPKAPPVRARRRVPWVKAVFATILVATLVTGFLMAKSVVLSWIEVDSGPETPPDPRQIGAPLSGSSSFVVYAPDGSLAAGGEDGLQIWAPDDRMVFSVGGYAKTAALSGDNQLAVSRWDFVSLHDIGPNGGWAGQYDVKYVEALAFNSDNTLLAMGNADNVIIWDLHADRQLGVLPFPDLPNARNRTLGLAFHPTDPNVLAVESLDSTQMWHARTGTPIGAPVAQDIYRDVEGAVSFSTDGTLMTAHGTIWSVDQRTPVCDPSVTNGEIAALSPNGRTAVLGNGYTAQESRLFDVATCSSFGEPLFPSLDFAFSPDSTTLASADLDSTTRWNVAR